jgi:hypothetical protein
MRLPMIDGRKAYVARRKGKDFLLATDGHRQLRTFSLPRCRHTIRDDD